MNIAVRIIIDIFLAGGCFFALAGTVGLIRMPDAFCRMQSSTNIATLGLLGIVIGGVLYAIFGLNNSTMAVKIAAIGVFTILTNPIGAHAICKAAYKHGVRPEKEMVCDEYGRDNPNE